VYGVRRAGAVADRGGRDRDPGGAGFHVEGEQPRMAGALRGGDADGIASQRRSQRGNRVGDSSRARVTVE
jgi:hypothetical protein